MDRKKVIQECSNQFMVRTKLHEASWADKIAEELVEIMEMVYGCGYDYGRDEIMFHQSREILQLSDYGNVISTYKSVNQAASAIGGDASNIRAVLNNRQHTAYGFHWRYVDSYFTSTNIKEPTDEENIS